MAKPVCVVPTGGKPVVSANDGIPVTAMPSSTGGQPVTIVADNGMPVVFTDVQTETSTWAAACTTPPSVARKGLIDALIAGLKADGVWTTLDWFTILASETAQAGMLNIRNPAKSLLPVGGIDTTGFTADRGFKGDGAAMYLSLGETMDNSAANNWTLNSAAFGFWVNLTTGGGLQGQVCSATARFTCATRTTGGNENFSINDATTNTLQANTGTRRGHRSGSRTGAAILRGYDAGVRVADLTTASTSLAGGTGYLVRGVGAFSSDRFSAFWSGGGKSDADVAAIHARLSSMLTAIGAN